MIDKIFDCVDSGTRILAAVAVTMAALIIIIPAGWILVVDPPNMEFVKARKEAMRRQELLKQADFNRWVDAGERRRR